MNKTKIDWADMTWNPVTGCLHGCEYCYARKIATRFKGGGYEKIQDMFIVKYLDDAFAPPYVLEKQLFADTKSGWYREAPYPFGFEPTFHRYRLIEPANLKNPQNIFVCSMADLFGEWVPDSWIKEVFKACEAAPQHRYLFLTKNPKRYGEIYRRKGFPYKENYWFGSTCTNPSDDYTWFDGTPYKDFVSIEPIIAPFGELEGGHFPKWIIVGAETGNRKDKIIPEREWIEDIVTDCKLKSIPLFMKESLRELMGDDFIQQYPWEEQRCTLTN